MLLHKKLLVTGSLFTILGAAGIAPTAYYWQQQKEVREVAVQRAPVRPAVQPRLTPRQEKRLITGTPVRITVPSLGLNHAVNNGNYDPETGEWTLSNDRVFFGTPSVRPNNMGGNTFIYGHALMNIFGRLPELKPGANVFVETDNGYAFRYRFRGSRVTDPTDVSLFSYQGKPIMTLQTCAGAWYQDRQLFTLDFVSVRTLR